MVRIPFEPRSIQYSGLKRVVEKTARRMDIPPAYAATMLSLCFEAIVDEVASGGWVSVAGFGLFASRAWRSPKTGRQHGVPKFSAARGFRAECASMLSPHAAAGDRLDRYRRRHSTTKPEEVAQRTFKAMQRFRDVLRHQEGEDILDSAH